MNEISSAAGADGRNGAAVGRRLARPVAGSAVPGAQRLARNTPWSLELVEAGDYVFALRRWPGEADAAMAGGVPARRLRWEFRAGDALPIARARHWRSGIGRATVNRDGQSDRFNVALKAGPVPVKTWFCDAAGAEIAGAYYVYVTRE